MPAPTIARDDAVLEVEVVDPRVDPQWDAWLADFPDAGPFHSSAWAHVLGQAYGHHPFYLRLHRDEQTVALVPLMEVASRLTGRRAVCLPFSDACGPLRARALAPRLLVDLLSRLGSERQWGHIEFRGSQGVPDSAGRSATFVGHQLALEGGEARLWDGMSPAAQRAIRKAERSDVTIEATGRADAMESFIRLHARTRRRHGLPPQPDRFFHAIQEQMVKPGLGTVVVARHHGAPVAAAVFFSFGQRALYKFGASDDRFQECRANNLVIWHGIRWAQRQGAGILSFGRTSPHQEGLRRFKRGWGASEHSIYYHTFTLPTAQWTGPKPEPSRVASVFFSLMPLAVNRVLGAAIYPHLD